MLQPDGAPHLTLGTDKKAAFLLVGAFGDGGVNLWVDKGGDRRIDMIYPGTSMRHAASLVAHGRAPMLTLQDDVTKGSATLAVGFTGTPYLQFRDGEDKKVLHLP